MLTVMGSVALDHVGRVARPAGPDEAARVAGLRFAFGGTAGNVAMALATLGEEPRLVTAAGPDFAASGYEARLARAGVDLAGVVRTEGPTAHAFLFTDDAGRQQIFFFPGESGEVRRAPVRRSALAHFSAGEFPAYPPHMEASDVVTFDPGQEIFHRPIGEIEPCFALADVLFVNEHELARLATLGWPLGRLLGVGLRAVVESVGAEGQVLHTPGGWTRLPGVPARAIDPTGAGDAHRAGFLWAASRGADDATACRVGSVVAAFCVEGEGPQGRLPALDEVRARYAAHYGAWPFEGGTAPGGR